jgi:hypothetical protein
VSEPGDVNEPGDLSSFSSAELLAIATLNLVECCAACRALLREQLEAEELDLPQL